MGELFDAGGLFTPPPPWSTWPGRGEHTGHGVTLIERWDQRIENAIVEFRDNVTVIRGGVTTVGRVRCSCGEEWQIGGFPFVFTEPHARANP